MSQAIYAEPADLPERKGNLPKIYPGPPQHQLEQLPDESHWSDMRAIVADWHGVDTGTSLRSVTGTLAMFIPEGDQKAHLEEHFLIGNEFAHHHPHSDGGLHMVLPSEWFHAAIDRGWAIPHTMCGQPTVSQWTVLVFAPRDQMEIGVVQRLIEVSEQFARGH